jgi:Flp pilus assembly protein TadD/predicted Ser/Thr protein kinase
VPFDTTGLPPGATFGASGVSTAGGQTTVYNTASSGPEPPMVPAAAGPLKVGQSFGPRYHIIKLLGAGGMGAVYQAWDSELSVAVAVKVIRVDRKRGSASSEAEKRFKNELLLARQVTHKNVVRIHDLGEISGIKYITMSYVQGDDLGTVLRRDRKLTIARALHLSRQIAAGLEAAHEAGVVHRDLKPPNIMVGADDLALIMDFGISASRDEMVTGTVVGTLEYMAPEQSKGEAVDGRADIYAFGLILYEMLTGPRGAVSGSAQARIDAMRQRVADGLPPARTIDPSIPEALDAFVARCLDRDPAARFQTAQDMSAALARLDDAGERIPEPARIRKSVLAATAVLGLAVIVGTYAIGRRAAPVAVQHEPVSVVIADFRNTTGDQTFDRTLEPMLKIALEGAGFISAYDRTAIAKNLEVKPPDQMDERSAQELAVKQGLGVVLSGSVDRQGNRYGVSMKASEAVTGKLISSVQDRASNKNQVLGVATRLATSIREALGDDTSDTTQRFAMETLSATSLDVVRDYATAAQAISDSKYQDAFNSFSKAVDRDKNFGLAYAGMAIASRNMDRQQDAEKYIKEAVGHLDGMTERERYKTRGLFYMITGDDQQCVKEFGDLVARYAADASARNNLALCLTYMRNMPQAVDEMRQVVKILPKRTLYRVNLALYAAYSGDFQTAEQEARAMPNPGWLGLLGLTFAQLLQGQIPQATETYQALGRVNDLGASYMRSGLADIALYEGRFSDAARMLTQGADSDLAAKDSDRAANKFAALAYTQVLAHQNAAAVAAAEKALANSKAVKIRFLAGRVFNEAGAADKARSLASELGAELHAEPQAYAKILEGEAVLKAGDARQAIKLLSDANGVRDTWIGHFDLGRAFLEAGAFTQADSEFDRCFKRRGESLALFLDEEPTYGFFPPLYYYQGRVREGLNNARFADSYRAYLDVRGGSTEDPLIADIRKRLRH